MPPALACTPFRPRRSGLQVDAADHRDFPVPQLRWNSSGVSSRCGMSSSASVPGRPPSLCSVWSWTSFSSDRSQLGMSTPEPHESSRYSSTSVESLSKRRRMRLAGPRVLGRLLERATGSSSPPAASRTAGSGGRRSRRHPHPEPRLKLPQVLEVLLREVRVWAS